MISNQHELC